MKSRMQSWWWVLCLVGSLVAVAPAAAAIDDDETEQEEQEVERPETPSETVVHYDLSGPRLGLTFTPSGTSTSQFGWHFERQSAPGTKGPWFIVETVLLAGGLERSLFVPNANLIFGIRLPSGVEFGIGPSVTFFGSQAVQSSLVVAAGQSFRVGGIRIPVNVAYTPDDLGDYRISVMTGWAVRDGAGK